MYESGGTPTPAPKAIPSGWNLVAWIQMSDFLLNDANPKFYGLIAQNASNLDSFILAIRGTEGAVEWWDDAHWASTPFDQVPNAGRVAVGFDRIYETMNVVPCTAAASAGSSSAAPKPLAGTFAEQVAQVIRSNAATRVPGLESLNLTMPFLVVCGHSLGAALCTLYVVENAVKKIINNPTVCTFASPRVGNEAFVQAYNNLGLTSWRIVNAPDIVPNLPPDIFGYQHVNAQSLFNSTGTVKSTIRCAHVLETYLSLLDPSAKPGPDCLPQVGDQAMSIRALASVPNGNSTLGPEAADGAQSVEVPTSGGITVNVNIYTDGAGSARRVTAYHSSNVANNSF